MERSYLGTQYEEHLSKLKSKHLKYFEYKTLFGVLSDGGSSGYASLMKKVDVLAMEMSDPQKECKALFGVLSDGGSSSETSLTKKVDVLVMEKPPWGRRTRSI